MGVPSGIAAVEPQTEAGVPAITLARFLSSLVSNGLCFCCGSPTDLALDGGGLISVRCARCGAEITGEETGCGERTGAVLCAA